MDPPTQQSPVGGVQLRQLSELYPAGNPTADKLSSSAPSRSADGPFAHPQFSRQNSDQVHGSSLDNPAQSAYMVNQHHDLYPAPPGVYHHHRQPPYHHGSPQSWPPYEQGLAMNMASGLPASYDSFPTASPYPPPRLSPPPTALSMGGYSHLGRHAPLAGSLDPTTGIFYRTPDHPRLRTAQACEKCRTRKAKCSGDHPSCKRCISRGLICEYAKEGRVRGPNKPKVKPPAALPDGQQQTASSRNRSSSTNTSSSTGSSDYFDVPTILTSLRDPRINFQDPQGSMGSAHSRRGSSAQGEGKLSRNRSPNSPLEATPNHYHHNAPNVGDAMQHPSSPPPHSPRTESSYQREIRMANLPRSYPAHDSPGVPHYQPMYIEVEGPTLVQAPYRTDHTPLPLTHPAEHFQQGEQRDSQLKLGGELTSQYQVERVGPLYDSQGYLVQQPSVGIDNRPTLSSFSSETSFATLDSMQALNLEHAAGQTTSIAQGLTPLASTWVDLAPASSHSPFCMPLSRAGSSGSSTTTTEASYRHKHPGGTHSTCQGVSLSMHGQPHLSQNISCAPNTLGDPHQDAAGRRSELGFVDEPIGRPGGEHFMVYP